LLSQIDLQVQATGERLDRYLAEQLPDLSRSRIQKLIEQGQVWVNGTVCLSKKVDVQVGDRLTLVIPDAEPLDLQAEQIPLTILYEDEQLLILNKPTGLVVHPAPGHPGGTLVNALLSHCPDLAGIGGVQRPGIVHRLDKDTSGAIAIAKTDQAHHSLQAQFKAKTAGREYLAIVYGAPAAAYGTIDAPIGRHPIDRKKMADELHRLALVAKGTSNIVIITDLDYKMTWVNEGFTRITGYSFEEALGKSPKMFQFEKTNPETIKLIAEKLSKSEAMKC